MPTRLPPLSMLRTFEVAARHGNLSRAGQELHVTHGAVSHQVKSLEEMLGVTLFRRERRGVTLTTEGVALAAVMRDAMATIQSGVEAIRMRPGRTITVSVLPAFATHWLIPRLGDFQARHPDVEVNIRAGQELVDFARDEVDLAVRYGPGTWPGVTAIRLMEEQVFPVCTPKFAREHRLENLGALAQAPLLHSPTQPWDAWFRSAGGVPPARRRGPTFSESGLLLRAALDGLGVALARSVLVQPDLEARRLIRPMPQSVAAEFAYYVVHPAHRQLSAAVATFRDWLLQARGARGGAAKASRSPVGTARPDRACATGGTR